MGNDNLASWPLRSLPDGELETKVMVSPQAIQQPDGDFNEPQMETGGHCQVLDNANLRSDSFSSDGLSLSGATGTQSKVWIVEI